MVVSDLVIMSGESGEVDSLERTNSAGCVATKKPVSSARNSDEAGTQNFHLEENQEAVSNLDMLSITETTFDAGTGAAALVWRQIDTETQNDLYSSTDIGAPIVQRDEEILIVEVEPAMCPLASAQEYLAENEDNLKPAPVAQDSSLNCIQTVEMNERNEANPGTPVGTNDLSSDNKLDDEFGEFDEALASENESEINWNAPSVFVLDSTKLDNIELPGPPIPALIESKDYRTSTSQLLWARLVTRPRIVTLDWRRSRIHKKLATFLGLPLDLDQTLPPVQTRRLVLPGTAASDLPGEDKIPHWELLTTVRPEALARLNDEELDENTAVLKKAISAAEQLRDVFELKELDLLAEKDVLDGMVESLTVYTQKLDRERLQPGRKKK